LLYVTKKYRKNIETTKKLFVIFFNPFATTGDYSHSPKNDTHTRRVTIVTGDKNGAKI